MTLDANGALSINSAITNAITVNGTGGTGSRIQVLNDVGVGLAALTYASTYVGGTAVGVGANGTVFGATGGNLGIACKSGSSIIFGGDINSSSGERMRISSAGDVGIGVTPSGSYKLEVAGAASFNGNTLLQAGFLRIVDGGSAATPSIQPGNDNNTGMYWVGSDTLGFTTGGTQCAAFTSQGQLNTYANSTGYIAVLQNASANPLGVRSHYSGAAPNGTGNVFFIATDTAGTKFTVRSNGGIANYSANNVNLSDRREKRDFEPSGDYLEKLCQIPVQKFRYISQAEDDDTLSIGVIAQDVQAICPELVMESDWSNGDEDSGEKMRLSIYQTDLEYAMLRAIQELKEELDSVKSELATLKSK